ncbi:MAG: hypothetical protein GY710_10495 [Desulfobacteraceae bacterium]|nr:hypothetical protein [Desulfobacteraceae bacterium]
MNDSRVLRSTQALFDILRGKILSFVDKPFISKNPLHRLIPIKTDLCHCLTLGVFIGEKSLALVLTDEKKHGADKELIKWSHIRFPEDLDIKDKDFPLFLKSSITKFLGKNKKVAVWTAIESKYLKLRNIVLPDLKEGKIANAALWGLKKDIDIDPAKEIFDYDFIADTWVDGVKKKNVVAFAGEKEQLNFIKNLFSTAGFSLTGITAMPFALQNFIRTGFIKADESPILMVNIARHSSEISCLSKKGVFLTRNLRTGSAGLVEKIM